MIVRSGEVGGDVVEQHRVGVAQLDAAPARAGPRRCRSGRCGTAPGRRGSAAPRTAGRPPGRWARTPAGCGWNLNPRTPCSSTSRRASRMPATPAGGVDRAERDEHVGVLGGEVGDLLVGQRGLPGGRLGVDGEDDGGHVLGAVVRGDVRHGRVVRVALEVLRGGGRAARRPARGGRGCRRARGCARRSATRLSRSRLQASLRGAPGTAGRRSAGRRRTASGQTSAMASADQPCRRRTRRRPRSGATTAPAGRRRCRWPGR